MTLLLSLGDLRSHHALTLLGDRRIRFAGREWVATEGLGGWYVRFRLASCK